MDVLLSGPAIQSNLHRSQDTESVASVSWKPEKNWLTQVCTLQNHLHAIPELQRDQNLAIGRENHRLTADYDILRQANYQLITAGHFVNLESIPLNTNSCFTWHNVEVCMRQSGNTYTTMWVKAETELRRTSMQDVLTEKWMWHQLNYTRLLRNYSGCTTFHHKPQGLIHLPAHTACHATHTHTHTHLTAQQTTVFINGKRLIQYEPHSRPRSSSTANDWCSTSHTADHGLHQRQTTDTVRPCSRPRSS